MSPPPFNPTSQVEIVSAGAAPLKKLRYDLAAFTPQTLRVEVRSAKHADFVHGKFPDALIPGLGVQVALSPQSKTERGELTCQFALTTAELLEGPYDPNFRPSFGQGAQSLVGVKGSFVIDDRGLVRDLSFDVPTTVPKLMEPLVHGLRAALGEVAVPLPEAEVGVGGSWSLKTTIASPYVIEQTKVFHLANTAPTGSQLKIELTQVGGFQRLRESSSSKMILESFAGQGSGSAKLVTGRLASASTLDLRSTEVARTPQRSAEHVTTKAEMSIVTTVLKP